MELDIGQLRAFVAVVDQPHFGRAADKLFLSQQGLSRRIRRLELIVGQRLFDRGPGGVTLTPAGRRFLPHARRVLASADAATAAMAAGLQPARIDVWGQVQAPLTIVSRFNHSRPDLVLELSMRRGTAAAVDALARDELDAAFGRPHDLDRTWPDRLARRPAYLEPLVAAVVEGHPLADEPIVHPADLRRTGVWWPLVGSPAELIGFFQHFGDEHDIPVDLSGPNLGLDRLLTDLQDAPERVTLLGRDWPLPPGTPVCRIPLEPTPAYPWHIIWPIDRPHTSVRSLLDFLADTARQDGWLDADPDHTWIPHVDRADLHDDPQ